MTAAPGAAPLDAAVTALTAESVDAAIARLGEGVAEASVVVPVGGRTHWAVGGPPPVGTEVRAPAGVVEYDPAELTVTVGAGTTVAELDAVLAAAGQHCPLDPRDPAATVGGILATGLSGVRRLRYGPLRNRLLEVHFLTGDGRRIKGGGRTVKNVSGYDVARLLVGSLGTLGVIVQVTLRCEPRPPGQAWLAFDGSAGEAVARAFRPSAVLASAAGTAVLVEAHPDDVAAEAARLDAAPLAAGPALPDGPHRGRIAVRPSALDALGAALGSAGIAWLGEGGVGTVHVATADPAALLEARRLAHAHGGWLLREAGAPEIDGFGVPLPNHGLMHRVAAALDPHGCCNPGRLPFHLDPEPGAVEVETVPVGP